MDSPAALQPDTPPAPDAQPPAEAAAEADTSSAPEAAHEQPAPAAAPTCRFCGAVLVERLGDYECPRCGMRADSLPHDPAAPRPQRRHLQPRHLSAPVPEQYLPQLSDPADPNEGAKWIYLAFAGVLGLMQPCIAWYFWASGAAPNEVAELRQTFLISAASGLTVSLLLTWCVLFLRWLWLKRCAQFITMLNVLAYLIGAVYFGIMIVRRVRGEAFNWAPGSPLLLALIYAGLPSVLQYIWLLALLRSDIRWTRWYRRWRAGHPYQYSPSPDGPQE